MSFFEKEFLSAVQKHQYVNLKDGVTKIRILSSPLSGYECWKDKKVSRFPINEKPNASDFESCRPFTNFIVWNYNEEKIQILSLKQATIINPLAAHSEDPDWGSPHQYDIKINRVGNGINTKYTISVSPKSPISEEIKENYRNNPCWLPATFQNDDPFNQGGMFTEPLFEETKENLVTDEQFQTLSNMLNQDDEYQTKVRDGIKKTYGVDNLMDLTLSQYDKVLNQVNLYFEEKKKKTLDHNNEVPF